MHERGGGYVALMRVSRLAFLVAALLAGDVSVSAQRPMPSEPLQESPANDSPSPEESSADDSADDPDDAQEEPSRSGSLPKEAIRTVIRHHIGEVRACYEQGLDQDPDLDGRVTISFVISPTGAVQSSEVARTTLDNQRVETCISEAVGGWSFPQPTGGGVVVVNYPFMLTSTGAPTEPPGLAPREVSSPPVERFTLSNGLEVVLQRDDRASQVGICTAYRVGSRDDPEGYHGLAHVMEHVALRGSDNAPGGYIPLLEEAGAYNHNATTDRDRTFYFATLPPASLDRGLWIEADRLGYLLTGLTGDDLADERRIVTHEWHERGGGWVRDLMSRSLFAELYPVGHPYRSPFDELDDIARVSLSDIQWHFQRHYQPNNARLAVVGQFDVDQTRARIEEWFGPIVPQRARPPARPPNVIGGFLNEVVVHMKGDVGRDRVIVAWPTPTYLEPADAVLDLVADVLAGPGSAPLQRSLVGGRLATEVGARQASGELGSHFYVGAVAGIYTPASALLRAIDVEVARLSRELVSAERVEVARRRIEQGLIANDSGLSSRACGLAQHDTPAGAPYDIAFRLGRYGNIDPEAVRHAVRRYLRPERRVIVILENQPGAGPPHVVRISRREDG